MTVIEDAERLARMAGFALHPDHLPGVALNLGLLRDQLEVLTQPPIDPLVEPAAVFDAGFPA